MAEPAGPFPLSTSMEPQLRLVHDYWEGLIRGDNDMPFWDDFKPGALPEAAPRIALFDVFDKPLRLRFGNVVGADIESRYGEVVRGLFTDEINLRTPFEYLNAQANATVETRQPTYYRHAARPAYSRLLLPMWGEGRIGMLLGAFVFA